ncbi:MAG: penicillin-binding protein 1B [Desulfuromonadales bacterium]|nr:penicillin-binding protein 1B [Desulfuromonadales bacterium]
MRRRGNEQTMAKRLKIKKRYLISFALIGLLLAAAFTVYLDVTVRARFEGKRFALPARVYARSLELYPGLRLSPAEMKTELDVLDYRETPLPREPGSYQWRNDTLELMVRPFVFADGPQAAVSLRVEFDGHRVARVLDAAGKPLPLARLDPPLIGGIYPGKNEDRVLVKLADVPRHVVDALIAVEDRRFYSHYGIDPRGIARAFLATASGDSVQGGSTLTQQLVKNFFLTAERTLQRKLTEMVMAILLEHHYSKEEILETYLNEVYLGQDGNRAIHGFGLAAPFFFNKPLTHLEIPEAAVLVGMLKGPTYYNPRSQPARALERRNLVLGKMAEEGFISDQRLQSAKAAPLAVVSRPPRGTSPHPAFLTLVYRQLERDYRDQDLRSEGLRIFTTLNPGVQRAAESALSQRLARLEKGRGMKPGTLEGALIVTSAQNAEVQAVVGGSDPAFKGFNRALDAQRPIGSLIKPVVFLTALQQPQSYTLATLVDDTPLLLQQAGTVDWAPQNFDKQFHGTVSLRAALMHSYNVPTVRVGLALGVPQVMANLRRLGMRRELPEFASSLLGTNALSPLEVTQIYQTMAGGGFHTPLRAIHAVLTAEGEPLQRYPLTVEQEIDPAPLFLLTTALQDVVREGTAVGLGSYLSSTLAVAGKTGTTDDFRDSWFAGFTGDRLAVVWVGRDDNESTGLTGASGAMTVWGEMMAGLNPEPLILSEPADIERVWIDPVSGLLGGTECQGAVELPFISGSAPTESAPCRPGAIKRSIKGFFQRIFGR